MANDPPDEPRQGEMRLLLLPPTNRDAVALRKLFAGERLECVLYSTLAELCEAINVAVGAVIVSEEAVVAGNTVLMDCVVRQPVWSDIPIIVLARSGTENPQLTRLLPYLGNVTVLERPVRMSTLVTLVRSALRARQRQYEIRGQFAEVKRAEEQLRQSEERLQLALRTGKLGVWELAAKSYQLECSAGCKAHFGLSANQRLNFDDFLKAVHPQERERVEHAVAHSMATQAEYDIEYRVIWPDGSLHWVLARGRPVDGTGEPADRMVGVTLDITDRKTIEEQKASLLASERAARSDAERAGRMKDEFLATLSHELRTPLNAILGWTQILQMGGASPEDVTEGVTVIERNARVQTQIIEDLLDMSRIISGKIRLEVHPLDLTAVIEAAAATVKPAADARDIRIRKTLVDSPAQIIGDPNRLQQVFWNLLSNAVKFTPRGGEVSISLQRDAGSYRVSVVDTGEGIDPRFLPQVFDRFMQADSTSTRRHGGLGLGLAIVKQLVEIHGGSVKAVSEGKGKGSRFTVALPVQPIETPEGKGETPHLVSPAEAVAMASSVRADFGALRIAIVDDEADSRGVLQRLLEHTHAQVRSAASVREAIEILSNEKMDLLISDIGMPGEDGYALIRRVRNMAGQPNAHIPAIALTAYARNEDRATALSAGFNRHIAKPVKPGELIAAIGELIRARA